MRYEIRISKPFSLDVRGYFAGSPMERDRLLARDMHCYAGTMSVTDEVLEHLRELPADVDGHVDDDLQMWVFESPYEVVPVF